MKKTIIGIQVILLISTVLLILSCGGSESVQEVEELDYEKIIRDTETVTLAWDPPTTDIAGNAASPQSYKLYYRIHETQEWTFIAEISATDQPEYELNNSSIGNGVYNFAVSAVSGTGLESDLHTSLDQTASPTTGWYLNWSVP